jgi:hypothetical protein
MVSCFVDASLIPRRHRIWLGEAHSLVSGCNEESPIRFWHAAHRTSIIVFLRGTMNGWGSVRTMLRIIASSSNSIIVCDVFTPFASPYMLLSSRPPVMLPLFYGPSTGPTPAINPTDHRKGQSTILLRRIIGQQISSPALCMTRLVQSRARRS